MVCGIDIFCGVNFKHRSCKAGFFIIEIFVKAFDYFSFLADGQSALSWVVLKIHLDDQVTADRIFLVCSITVYLDFHGIGAVGISIWCSHFFDAVISTSQILWQDQVSVFIRKIGFMYRSGWISSHLFYIFLVIQIVYFKFSIRNQNRFLCLVIFFDDF